MAEAETIRTTITIDDDLLREAQKVTGIKEHTALVNEGIRALIARESARRLARLGGNDPKRSDIPMRWASDSDRSA